MSTADAPRRTIRSLPPFLLLAVSFLAACHSASSDPSSLPPAPKVEVQLEPKAVQLYRYDTQKFIATVKGLKDTSVIWEPTGGEVAVEQAGAPVCVFTATQAHGDFTLKATAKALEKASDTAKVTILPPELSFEAASARVEPGQSVKLSPRTKGLKDEDITWTPDEAAAKLGSLDKPTGTSVVFAAGGTPGKGKVTASFVDMGETRSCSVDIEVAKPSDTTVRILPVGARFIFVDHSQTFQAEVSGSEIGEKDKGVTWSVKPDQGVSLDPQQGVFTASAAGEYTLVATSVHDTSKSDELKLTVHPLPVIGVRCSKEGSIEGGETVTFTATVEGDVDPERQCTSVQWARGMEPFGELRPDAADPWKASYTANDKGLQGTDTIRAQYMQGSELITSGEIRIQVGVAQKPE